MLFCWLLCMVSLSVRLNCMHKLTALVIGKWLICASLQVWMA